MISSLATINPNLKPFAAVFTRNFPIGNASLKLVKFIHLYNTIFVKFEEYSVKNNVGILYLVNNTTNHYFKNTNDNKYKS